jgi:flagellin
LDGVTVLDQAAGVGTTVTNADISAAVVAYADATAGYSRTGTTVGVDLVITKDDGTDVNLTVLSNFGAGGALGGTVTSTNGTTTGEATASPFTLSLDGVALDFTTTANDGVVTGTEVANTINAVSGYTASFGGGNVTITKADGSNVVLLEGGGAPSGGFTGGSQTLYGSVSISSSTGDIVVGGAASANAGLTSNTYAAAISGVTVADTDISSVNGANDAIVTIDAALDTINSSRGDLGAIQSRFESVVSSLSTTSENLSAARSRIQDADFAAETAQLTKSQILQQAGISILAQANSQPQLVLSLLQ